MTNNSIQYEAIAMGDQFERGRLSGRLTIESGFIVFRSGPFEKRFAIDGIEISRGGASDSLLFFSDPSDRSVTLYTRDSAILNEPSFAASDAALRQVVRLQKQTQKKRLGFVALLLVSIAALYGTVRGGVYLKEYAVRSIVKMVPLEWEEKLGNAAFSQVHATPLSDLPVSLQNDLKKITEPLVAEAKSGDRHYRFRFYLSPDPEVNAFALPGGIVVIQKGLVEKARSPEELAGVIAHELSHVTQQHSLRQLTQTIGLYLVMQAFLGDVEGLFAVLLENSGYLLTLKFSRDFEAEADEGGFKTLVDAKIDPAGMISFFETLEKLERKKEGDSGTENGDGTDAGGDSYLEMIRTHPDTAKRIAALKKRYERIDRSRFRRLSIDFDRFKKGIAGIK